MSNSLYVALRSGHDHTALDLAEDEADETRRRIAAHIDATEQHPVLRLSDGTVIRTDDIVLCRVVHDVPRTGFVPRGA